MKIIGDFSHDEINLVIGNQEICLLEKQGQELYHLLSALLQEIEWERRDLERMEKCLHCNPERDISCHDCQEPPRDPDDDPEWEEESQREEVTSDWDEFDPTPAA